MPERKSLLAEMIYSGDPYHPGYAAEWRETWEAAVPLQADERKRLKYLEDVSVELFHRLKEDNLWAALADRFANRRPAPRLL